MRGLVFAALALIGCTDDTVSHDTSFRRLVDAYPTFEDCVAATPFEVCYQTLTLCPDGVALLDLENHLEDGKYKVEASIAKMTFVSRTVLFDLDRASSPQLPGAHPWESNDPVFTGCAP